MFATGSVPADTAKMFRVTQGMIGRKMTGLVSVCGTGEVARVAKSERGLRQTWTGWAVAPSNTSWTKTSHQSSSVRFHIDRGLWS